MMKEIKRIIADISNVGIEEVTMDTHFIEDLEWDSMDILELVTTLEKNYKIDIKEKDFFKLTTISGVKDIVTTLQKVEFIDE